MRKFSAKYLRSHWLFLLTALFAANVFQNHSARAQTTKGPSAIAAARLKNKPPRNWIRHYLGDDRYKIAGGVWKVVSTELDRYYYPAWAPEMLRQPAGIVIGFASAQEAEDAGYLPSAYGSANSLYGLTPAEIASAKNRGKRGPIPLSGTRITLSDGRSTVVLPKGWKHTAGRPAVDKVGSKDVSYSDLLKPPSNDLQAIRIYTGTIPNTDVANYLTAQKFPELEKKFGSNAGSTGFSKSSNFKAVNFGGLPAIYLTPSSKVRNKRNASMSLTIIGRGTKIYAALSTMPATSPGFLTIANSFQPG